MGATLAVIAMVAVSVVALVFVALNRRFLRGQGS